METVVHILLGSVIGTAIGLAILFGIVIPILKRLGFGL